MDLGYIYSRWTKSSLKQKENEFGILLKMDVYLSEYPFFTCFFLMKDWKKKSIDSRACVFHCLISFFCISFISGIEAAIFLNLFYWNDVEWKIVTDNNWACDLE